MANRRVVKSVKNQGRNGARREGPPPPALRRVSVVSPLLPFRVADARPFLFLNPYGNFFRNIPYANKVVRKGFSQTARARRSAGDTVLGTFAADLWRLFAWNVSGGPRMGHLRGSVVLTLRCGGNVMLLSWVVFGSFWGLWWCLRCRLGCLHTSARVPLVRRAHLDAC